MQERPLSRFLTVQRRLAAAPLFFLGLGFLLAVLWGGAAGQPIGETPIWLAANAVVALGGLVTLLRGVPSWGYSWLGLALASPHALAQALLVPRGAAESPDAAGQVAIMAGPLVAAAAAVVLSDRSWGSSFRVVAFYFLGTALGFSSGFSRIVRSLDAVSPEVQGIQLLVAAGQVALGTWAAASAVEGRSGRANLLLLALLVLSPLGMDLLFAVSPARPLGEEILPFGNFLLGYSLLYLIVALLTFGGGALWRLFHGKHILTEGEDPAPVGPAAQAPALPEPRRGRQRRRPRDERRS